MINFDWLWLIGLINIKFDWFWSIMIDYDQFDQKLLILIENTSMKSKRSCLRLLRLLWLLTLVLECGFASCRTKNKVSIQVDSRSIHKKKIQSRAFEVGRWFQCSKILIFKRVFYKLRVLLHLYPSQGFLQLMRAFKWGTMQGFSSRGMKTARGKR